MQLSFFYQLNHHARVIDAMFIYCHTIYLLQYYTFDALRCYCMPFALLHAHSVSFPIKYIGHVHGCL